MSGYTDEDGIDGPFDRAIRRAIREDAMDASARRRASLKKLHDPNTADNMDVRLSITRRMQAGEITLTEAQDELKRIKASGRRQGKAVWGGR